MKKLHSVNVYPESISVVYNVSQNNGKTTLEVPLELVGTSEGWKSVVDFNEIEFQKNPTDSAHALADWFERIAEEIKKHNFDEVNFNSL